MDGWMDGWMAKLASWSWWERRERRERVWEMDDG